MGYLEFVQIYPVRRELFPGVNSVTFPFLLEVVESQPPSKDGSYGDGGEVEAVSRENRPCENSFHVRSPTN